MEKVESADGTAIAFDRFGSGAPVVLVDGAFGNRGFPSAVADGLARHFTVLRYDRRGRHDSGDAPDYAPEREIEDLAAVVAAAGGRPAVFGMSSGACLALDAAEHGVPMSRLALYEPPFLVDDTRAPVPRDYVDTINRMVAEGRRGDAVEFVLTTAVEVPAEVVAQIRTHDPNWPAMEALAHTLAYDGVFIGELMRGRPLPAQRWANVTLPTLVIDGDASPGWARNGVAALARILPAARRASLPGQTHDVDAGVLVPVLVDFLS